MLQFYQVLPDDVDVADQEPHFAKLYVKELFISLISGESPLFFDLKPFRGAGPGPRLQGRGARLPAQPARSAGRASWRAARRWRRRPAGGRGGRRGGLGARRAVTAARRGGASRLPAGEPWREAAPRRPHQCPRLQQRPRPPPRGPPRRRARAPRARDARAPRVRRPRRGAARGRERGAAGAPRRPPRPGTADPEPSSAKSAASSRRRGRRSRTQPRAPLCRPAGSCGGNGSRRAAGAGPRTTKRRRPTEPSSRRAPRGRPPGPRLRRGRAPCASLGFPVRSPCWYTTPTGGCPPDCPRLRQWGPRWQWAPSRETCQAGRHSSARRHFGQLCAPSGGVQPCSPSLQPGHP
ncbi:proline-rich proteoglycan 2-like [Mustela erminea]|uniref:proline-rich proteoglycan 2-like n=1 Tax=Mustela erminea TaxID=36723 RepID=UPI001386DA6C|nr:proline-rich proteoglycan 2-like [Mustela erminea]